MKYYVKAATAGKVLFSSAELLSINNELGTSNSYDSDSFTFIQQVFNTVYSTDTYLQYETVTVKVYLQAGDHFFFTCGKDFIDAHTFTPNASFSNLCNDIPKLAQKDPRSDNFEF